jgi:hypothetical protein
MGTILNMLREREQVMQQIVTLNKAVAYDGREQEQGVE